MSYLLDLIAYFRGPYYTSEGIVTPKAPILPYFIRVIGAFMLVYVCVVVGLWAEHFFNRSIVEWMVGPYRIMSFYLVSEILLVRKGIVSLWKLMVGYNGI